LLCRVDQRPIRRQTTQNQRLCGIEDIVAEAVWSTTLNFSNFAINL
jgi:hypothetical protein